MNDQFGFDLNPFGMDSFAPQQSQQQQQQQQQQHAYLGNNGLGTNGPSLDNYDPNQVLMPNSIVTSPYNMGQLQQQQQQQRSNNHSTTQNGYQVNRQQHSTHQILMPGTNLNAQHPSRRTSSSSQNSHGSYNQRQQQQQQQQQLSGRGMNIFDPAPIQRQLQSTSRSSTNTTNSMSVGASGGLSYQTQQRQQQQRQSLGMHIFDGQTTAKASVTSHFSVQSSNQQLQQQDSRYTQQQRQKRRVAKPEIVASKPKKEEWLEKLQVKVSGVSLEPMTGTQIIELLRKRANEVLSRYLPCVDFLVQCQQELRKGLQIATSKRYSSHGFRDALTPRQFHSQYISNLPGRFYKKNIGIMSKENLTVAYKEIEKLVANAKAVENQGCEVVKNTFLGGMKDGESWGLRKWLSKQGGALHICNDTECLSTSCQKLDRDAESTCKLAARLRPLADAALKKLKSEIPASYQEQSSAHPYLPFFHRLECALRGMANFDPEDDDVICIVDDDEVEELKAKASTAPPPSNKRKRSRNKMSGESKPVKRKAPEQPKFTPTFNDDDDSDIEVLEQKPPPKRSNTKKAATNGDALDFGLEGTTGVVEDESDIMQSLLNSLEDDKNAFDFDAFDKKNDMNGSNGAAKYGAFDLADGLECIACFFDNNNQDRVRPDFIEKEPFWDSRYQYASALRLFCDILRNPDCTEAYLETADEDELIQEGKLPYTEIVRHPLSFRDIAGCLFEDYNMLENDIKCSNGTLPHEAGLYKWNMWKGKDLLQAIDLVLLNSLAYGKANDGPDRTSMRSRTNKLRKLLWAGIKDVIDDNLLSNDPEERKKCTPTRRGESSGFVVKKGS